MPGTQKTQWFTQLHDVEVNGTAQLGININGVEEIDGLLCVQSWWCRNE